MKRVLTIAGALLSCLVMNAQKYQNGLVDKTVAVLGGEVILISDIENEVQQMRAGGQNVDQRMRCELLQGMMESKLFLMSRALDIRV